MTGLKNRPIQLAWKSGQFFRRFFRADKNGLYPWTGLQMNSPYLFKQECNAKKFKLKKGPTESRYFNDSLLNEHHHLWINNVSIEIALACTLHFSTASYFLSLSCNRSYGHWLRMTWSVCCWYLESWWNTLWKKSGKLGIWPIVTFF